MSGRWHAALGWALTGQELELRERDAPDVDAALDALASAGWDRARIEAHASGVRPWPHPVPDALRAGLGAAQLAALVRSARERLGLVVLTTLPPSRRTQLNPDERRLLADVPPHFGRT